MHDVASEFPAAAVPPAGGPAKARFTGAARAFRKLMIRGALLQVVTLGIYRFWLTTDARRFLWANTEIEGDSLEYTGTATELFIGFLIAIALLVPIYVLFFIGTLDVGLVNQLSSTLAFVLLGIFGQYAYFRARRYRLTRTVFRGMRFHQTGSAAKYALRSLLWLVLVFWTLGLAYPWAQANLERYKLSHTFYGDLQGSFAGSGKSLFFRGILLWLLFVGTWAVAIAILAGTVDGEALGRASRTGRPDAAAGIAGAIIAAVAVGGMIVGIFVYTTFQAIVLRWWLAGLRFGPVVVATTLKKRQVVGAYLRCFLFGLLLLVVLCVVVGAVTALVVAAMTISKEASQILGVILVICIYLPLAVGVWVIYQMTIKLGIWRMAVDSLELAGFDAIERVRADDTRPSSAIGEGLADALGAGGI